MRIDSRFLRRYNVDVKNKPRLRAERGKKMIMQKEPLINGIVNFICELTDLQSVTLTCANSLIAPQKISIPEWCNYSEIQEMILPSIRIIVNSGDIGFIVLRMNGGKVACLLIGCDCWQLMSRAQAKGVFLCAALSNQQLPDVDDLVFMGVEDY